MSEEKMNVQEKEQETKPQPKVVYKKREEPIHPRALAKLKELKSRGLIS